MIKLKQILKDEIKRINQSMMYKNEKEKKNLNFLKNLSNVFDQYDWIQHQRFINTFKHYRLFLNRLDFFSLVFFQFIDQILNYRFCDCKLISFLFTFDTCGSHSRHP